MKGLVEDDYGGSEVRGRYGDNFVLGFVILFPHLIKLHFEMFHIGLAGITQEIKHIVVQSLCPSSEN